MSRVSGSLVLPDERSVTELARRFLPNLQAPLVIYLRGDLGAGKTTFARALIQALGYRGRVKSPSYGLLELYDAGGFNVLHLDLYRIGSPGELDYLAIRDLFDKKCLLLVEWPEKGHGFLPPADLELYFREVEGQRLVELKTCSDAGSNAARALGIETAGKQNEPPSA